MALAAAGTEGSPNFGDQSAQVGASRLAEVVAIALAVGWRVGRAVP